LQGTVLTRRKNKQKIPNQQTNKKLTNKTPQTNKQKAPKTKTNQKRRAKILFIGLLMPKICLEV